VTTSTANPVSPAIPARLGLLDLIQTALLGIRTRKTRAALSALGISIGIATMVIVTGVPASASRRCSTS
jgi:putative ABC transport system permease protein